MKYGYGMLMKALSDPELTIIINIIILCTFIIITPLGRMAPPVPLALIVGTLVGWWVFVTFANAKLLKVDKNWEESS